MLTWKQFNMFIFLALFRAYYLGSITVNVCSSSWTTYSKHQDRCTFLVFIDVLLRLDVRSILFRNRSLSFSVGLPRSACAIVSIVSVFMINIFASHIGDKDQFEFQQSDQIRLKKEMVHGDICMQHRYKRYRLWTLQTCRKLKIQDGGSTGQKVKRTRL